jgi:polyphosphate kinase
MAKDPPAHSSHEVRAAASDETAAHTIAPAPRKAERVRKPKPASNRGAIESGMFNRELSWLDFNARVLSLAANPTIPLLERVKFLSIFSSNLDEFYMVRVAGLMEQKRAGTRDTTTAGGSPAEQLEAISRRLRDLVSQQSKLWLKELQPHLRAEGIEIISRTELTSTETRYLRQYFQKQVFPVLTPMGVDPAHPFPHLQNRSLSLCVLLRSRGRARLSKPILYAFVEVPSILPRFIPLGSKRKNRTRFVLLSDVIALYLPQLFAGSEVVDSFPVRITRDSDLEIDEEDAEDLLKVVEAELRERQWGNAVRLEISSRAPEETQRFLQKALELEKRDVMPVEGPLNFAEFMELSKLSGFDHLRYPSFTPHIRPAWKQTTSIFDLIRSRDMLVHHPYESFSTVMDFVEQAATDPHVLAIKLTLYRTGPDSPLMRALTKAAANAKQVVVLVELKARFDEANNIQWARNLEREGIHVVYGIVGMKTHCKACLVVRREDKILRRYCHLSTGNYNHTTAQIYTDLGLFTADPMICEDVTNLFNMLTGFAYQVEWSKIVPSPKHMEEELLRLVRREQQIAKRGGKGSIICKMNSLVHPPLIEALYAASNAGVTIELIVRGICCLRPGVPGLSENIRVRSIVGRFLEHSRIFCFGNKGEPIIYLSSADWMQRNFYRRIEVMFPLEDKAVRQRILEEILPLALNDYANAWELRSDGTWKKRSAGSSGSDSQHQFVGIEEKLAKG